MLPQNGALIQAWVTAHPAAGLCDQSAEGIRVNVGHVTVKLLRGNQTHGGFTLKPSQA